MFSSETSQPVLKKWVSYMRVLTVFLMICNTGVGYLPFNFCCLELWMCQTFPILSPPPPPPHPCPIELRPCDRCFGPEWIPFPFTDLLGLNILRQFWAQSTVRPFLPEGINWSLSRLLPFDESNLSSPLFVISALGASFSTLMRRPSRVSLDADRCMGLHVGYVLMWQFKWSLNEI